MSEQVLTITHSKINLSGKSGNFVKCQGISRIIGILHPFLWRSFGCCHLENRKQVPCTLTCSSSYQYPAVSGLYSSIYPCLVWTVFHSSGISGNTPVFFYCLDF